MSLVTVIIPYYKKKDFIQKSIKSVLNQSYKKFEIILIYDDDSKIDLHLIKKISKQSKKIKLIINKKNIGAGMSRNKAIKISKGKYIAFLDSDDLWHPDKLKNQLNYMIKNKISISHTSYNIINENNFKFGFRMAKKLEYKDLLKSCDIGLSTVMIKRKILKNNLFAKLKTKEDYILWLKLAKKNYMFHPIKKPLTSWRALKESLSSSTIQKIIDGYYVYRIFLKQSFFKSVISLTVLSINFLRK